MESRRISRKMVPLAALTVGIGAIVLLLLPFQVAREPRVIEPPPPAVPQRDDEIRLRGGEIVRGEVLREGPDHVTILTLDGERRMISRDRIEGLERVEPRRGRKVRVRLRSGRFMEGELLEEKPGTLRVRVSPAGNIITLSRKDVTRVEPLD